MHPISTPDTNFTYSLPGGSSENDLPCVKEEDGVRSTWGFESLEEATPLLKGGAVYVHVHFLPAPAVKGSFGGELRDPDNRIEITPTQMAELGQEGVEVPPGVQFVFGMNEEDQQRARHEQPEPVFELKVFANPTPAVTAWVEERETADAA